MNFKKTVLPVRLLGRRRRAAPRRAPAGTPPEVLVASETAKPTVARAFFYGEADCSEVDVASTEDLQELGQGVTWLDCQGLGDLDFIRAVGERFHLHPLVVSDIVHAHQRPKSEFYDDYVVVVVREPWGQGGFESDQITMVIGERFLLTFQERRGDVFDPVRRRIRQGAKRLRQSGPGYLAYALIDAVVDAYFPRLEQYGDLTEVLEERVLANPDPGLIAEIHGLKRELVNLRRVLWPQREAINVLLREESSIFPDAVKVYLRDCADHSFQLLDMVEVYREVAQGLVDLHLSSVSNRMNEVMKVLTVIATIFIPLGFIAGLYGMNFDRASPWNMPELGWRFGYLFALGLMAATAIAMLIYFARRGWLGGRWAGSDRPPEAGPTKPHREQ